MSDPSAPRRAPDAHTSSAHTSGTRSRGPHAAYATLPAWAPLALAAALVAADQLLKGWALSNLVYQAPPVPAIPLLLDWVLTFNTGAAWSLFSGSALPLALGRMLVGLGLLAYVTAQLAQNKPLSRGYSLCLSAIAAGAIGNAIDGFTQGKVTDMIHMPLLSVVTNALGAGDFPIFNLADVCVVLGTLALVVLSFLEDREKAES